MLRLPRFRYLHPATVADAVAMKADAGPDSSFVAGGTGLDPTMNRSQRTAPAVTDLGRLEELQGVTFGEEGAVMGAGVLLSDLEHDPRLRATWPGLVHAIAEISTPLLRNMGTIGGNLLLDTRCNYYDQNFEWRQGINFCLKKDGDICWVAPGSSKCWAVQSSDLVPVMVAIGAKFLLASTLGERIIDAGGFYNDDGINYLKKRPDELLVDIPLPPLNGWRASYQKLRRRGRFA